MTLIAACLLAAPPIASLNLTIQNAVIQQGEQLILRATISNTSKKVIKLLETQDGSAHHWSNPQIGLAWMPDSREPMPTETPKCTSPRCGNVNPITAEMFTDLAPGKTAPVSLGWLPIETPKAGRYRVALYYEVVPGGKPRGLGALQEGELMEKYKALTPLKLRSNLVWVTIK